MRHPLLLLLLLAACSRGGAECLDSPDCPGAAACNLETLRCEAAPQGADLQSRPPDLARPDLAPAADLACNTAGGWKFCGAACVPPLGDDQNCGACGKACGASDLGQLSCCNLGCVDRQRDVNHCGRCFNVCGGSAPWCCGGTCSSRPC